MVSGWARRQAGRGEEEKKLGRQVSDLGSDEGLRWQGVSLQLVAHVEADAVQCTNTGTLKRGNERWLGWR